MTLSEIREKIEMTMEAIREKEKELSRLRTTLHDYESWEHHLEEASAGIL